MKMNDKILRVINILKNEGYEAYIVGGYVRDLLLEKENYDVDITTNATPLQVKKIFKNYLLDEKFIDLGSIKFKIDKYDFEITTFRKEHEYINHRKPSKIEYTTLLEEDLIRRDFTFNALCYDGNDIIDLFNGIEDLKNKKIKIIGDPFSRLNEDALRILRALRFSSILNFDIDDKITLAMQKTYKYLDEISFDVKYKELKKILNGENLFKTLKKYKNVFIDVFKLNKLDIDKFTSCKDYDEKEALFFYYSDYQIDNKYLKNTNLTFLEDKIDLKKKLNKYGVDSIYNLLYFRSNILGQDSKVFLMLKEIISNDECYNLKMLNINGIDLLNINVEKNKIGKYLNLLLDTVIENKCQNSKNELLKYLKENIIS